MRVVMSIHPEYVEKILDGTKTFELRRTLFRRDRNIKTVIIYATRPIQKVVGEFEIGYILHNNIDALWELTKDCAGIDHYRFMEYFKNLKEGFAIQIRNPRKYEIPLDLKDNFNVKPPQSYVFVEDI